MATQDGHSSLQNTCKLLAEQSLNLRAWPGYCMISSFVAWRPDLSLSWDEVDLSYGQWLLQASLSPTAMFARVLITLRMSVLLLTLTENLAAPRLCALTSTSPLAAGAETAARVCSSQDGNCSWTLPLDTDHELIMKTLLTLLARSIFLKFFLSPIRPVNLFFNWISTNSGSGSYNDKGKQNASSMRNV